MLTLRSGYYFKIINLDMKAKYLICNSGGKKSINNIALKRPLTNPALLTSKTPVQYIVIVFEETHGFYNFFGNLPGANGMANLTHLLIRRSLILFTGMKPGLKEGDNAVKGQCPK